MKRCASPICRRARCSRRPKRGARRCIRASSSAAVVCAVHLIKSWTRPSSTPPPRRWRKVAVDDRLGRALAVLANDCLGAATPLLRADLRLLVCSRVPFRRHRLAPIAAMACWRGLHCLYAIDATASSLTGGESAGAAGHGRRRAPRARGAARPAALARRRGPTRRRGGRVCCRGGATGA